MKLFQTLIIPLWVKYIEIEPNTTKGSEGSVIKVTINEFDAMNLLNLETKYGFYVKFGIAKIKEPQYKTEDGKTYMGTRNFYEFDTNKNLESAYLRITFISSKPAEKPLRR